MPVWVRFYWLAGVVLLIPIVITAGRFFVWEYGEVVGRLITFAIWVFIAALSYFAVWLFARAFLQDRD
jgi:uncharacterized membrane protein